MHVAHRFHLVSALALACAVAVPLAAPLTASADQGAPALIGYLNAQRAANGLPASIAEDPTLTDSCLSWLGGINGAAAGERLDYSTAGIAAEGGWTADHDPFEQHPQALALLLDPRLTTVGAAEGERAGCVDVAPTSFGPAPAADVTYSYPGDGAQDAHTEEVVAGDEQLHAPYTPGQQNAVPDPRTAGPYLYAFFDGPDFDHAHPATTHATAASLTGPSGPLAVDVQDGTTPGFPDTVPSEVQLIPRSTLQPFTRYTASVTADVTPVQGAPARTFTRTWSFTTGALENWITPLVWGVIPSISGAEPGDLSMVSFEVYSRAPQVTVTATGPGTPATGTAYSPPATYLGGWATLRLDRPGTWHVCFRSGGGDSNVRPAELCEDVNAGAIPQPPKAPPAPVVKPAKPGRPAATPKPLRVTLITGAHALVRGRTLSVPLRCSKACRLRVGATIGRGPHAVRLRAVRVSRKSAGTVTVRLVVPRRVVRRVRAAPQAVLTIVPSVGHALHQAVPIHAK